MNSCGRASFNKYCYVCGKHTLMSSKRAITSEIAELYSQYFDQTVIHDVDWAPSIICTTCLFRLNQWEKGETQSMPFGAPMIWTEPRKHNPDECYACVNGVNGINRAKRRKVEYRGTLFVQLPLPHSNSIPIPSRQTAPCNHIEISQSGLDKMVRRLKLSQRQSILLAQELKKSNILAPDVNICEKDEEETE